MNKIIFPKKKLQPVRALGSNQYKIRVYKKAYSYNPSKRVFASVMIVGSLSGIVLGQALLNIYNDYRLQPAYSPTIEKAYAQPVPEAPESKDKRISQLYNYLLSKNSPLASHAEYIVQEADRNDIPWTLTTSISGKESSFGKNIKSDSHNAWGIMAWDKEGKRFVRSFDSWEDSIKFESELLGNQFRKDINKGIQARYCPSFECSTTWVTDVTRFAEEIKQ